MIPALARPGEEEAILALYRACAHGPDCLWNDAYPDMENIREDMALDSLYVVREGDAILAAASLGPLEDMDTEDWPPLENPCELARLCVRPEARGRGLAAEMMEFLKGEALRRGFGGIRLCVGVTHALAQRLYLRAGFVDCGERSYFGGRYFCYQLELPGV